MMGCSVAEAEKCICGADAGDHFFDRCLCACGVMHYYCAQCGVLAVGESCAAADADDEA